MELNRIKESCRMKKLSFELRLTKVEYVKQKLKGGCEKRRKALCDLCGKFS